MSVHPYYGQCKNYMGRHVVIKTRDGRTHRGIVTNVSRSHVHLRPVGNSRNLGGYGYGYGFGYGNGAVWGVALGTITGLALASLFFW